ncbi:hypothetical protein M9H77_26863 [Catharanthus roseus]|uniref:Uncharacterized protein n=1 Tax=Catharanthus roseus TaxID=4058 RepID=A0ACC0ACS7_CATRO|nr:hypothetical protein M9H77_26863 [Catharanthus roseus]
MHRSEVALMCLDSLRLPSCARNPHFSAERHPDILLSAVDLVVEELGMSYEDVASQFINCTWHKLLNEIDELNPLAHKFVRVWTSKVLHFGVDTTNQIESEYSVLKLWLSTCHGDLDTVFLNIDSVIKGQIVEIKSSLEYSSHLALKKIWVELKIASEIIDDPKNKCGHYLRTSHGLPCLCESITRFTYKINAYCPLYTCNGNIIVMIESVTSQIRICTGLQIGIRDMLEHIY